MFGRRDLNAWLAEFFAEHVGPVLNDAGFASAGARSGRRRTEYGAQKIEFFVYSRPTYAPDKAHLTLNTWFFMREVMQLARQIFGPSFAPTAAEPSLAGGVALDSLPHRPLNLRLFADRAELHDHAPDVQRALTTWVLPFLDNSSTLSTFAYGPARSHLRVEVFAAAYVYLGQPDQAMDYLHQRAGLHDDAAAFLTPAPLQGIQHRNRRAIDVLASYLATDDQDHSTTDTGTPRQASGGTPP